jgi:hypothetical protein
MERCYALHVGPLHSAPPPVPITTPRIAGWLVLPALGMVLGPLYTLSSSGQIRIAVHQLRESGRLNAFPSWLSAGSVRGLRRHYISLVGWCAGGRCRVFLSEATIRPKDDRRPLYREPRVWPCHADGHFIGLSIAVDSAMGGAVHVLGRMDRALDRILRAVEARQSDVHSVSASESDKGVKAVRLALSRPSVSLVQPLPNRISLPRFR